MHLIRQSIPKIIKAVNIEIVVEKAWFVNIDPHTWGFTEGVKKDLKIHPVLESTRAQKDNIIHEEEVGENKGGRDLNAPNEAITSGIPNEKSKALNDQNEKKGG